MLKILHRLKTLMIVSYVVSSTLCMLYSLDLANIQLSMGMNLLVISTVTFSLLTTLIFTLISLILIYRFKNKTPSSQTSSFNQNPAVNKDSHEKEHIGDVFVCGANDDCIQEQIQTSHKTSATASFNTQQLQRQNEALSQDIFLTKLHNLVQHRYQDPELSIKQLATALAMSERQLQRKVKALADQSPNEYIKQFRLQQAKKQLLQQSNIQIGLVAQACGFSSQTYFGRCFRENYGYSPKEFQKQHKR